MYEQIIWLNYDHSVWLAVVQHCPLPTVNLTIVRNFNDLWPMIYICKCRYMIYIVTGFTYNIYWGFRHRGNLNLIWKSIYSDTSISAPSISAHPPYMHAGARSQAWDLELSAHLHVLHVMYAKPHVLHVQAIFDSQILHKCTHVTFWKNQPINRCDFNQQRC